MDFSIKLEGATLSTIAEGDLELQFQERLRELVTLFADPRRYVKTKDGRVRAVINAAIILESDSDGSMSVAVQTTLKKPAFNSVWRSIFRRGADYLVEKDPPRQQPLMVIPPFAVQPEQKRPVVVEQPANLAEPCGRCGAPAGVDCDMAKHDEMRATEDAERSGS